MSAWIELEGMHFYAYHGVLPQETQVGNNYSVDISVCADIDRALWSDALEDTINYALIYEVVKEQMAVPSALLERVAGRILARVFALDTRITEVRLSIAKCPPPLGGDVVASKVRLHLTRIEFLELVSRID